MKSIFIFLLFNLLLTSYVQAREVKYIGRSPRALLMGDAYTAIADDEYTLFYNPAAMGRNQGLSFVPIDPAFEVTNVLDELDRFEDFPSNDVSAIADRLLGFPVHLKASAFPGLKMASFGFNLFASSSTSMILRNAVHPLMRIQNSLDRGFVAGFAFNMGKGARKSGSAYTAGVRQSIGVGVKHMNREGLDGTFDLFGTSLLTSISTGVEDVDDLKEAFGFAKGKAWGVDLGYEVMFATTTTQFTMAASILDVGDTQFRKVGGTGDVPIQEMSINTGLSFRQDFKILDYTLSFDLHPLNQGLDFLRTAHAGAEINLPLVSVLAGWNAGYLSYGAALKLWPVKLYVGFYGVELGVDYKQEPGKRAVIQLSLFELNFDP
jgi:hypothetical protein